MTNFVKRSMDIIVAATVLALFSPLLLVIALVVFLDVGRPVLFRHIRPGLHGKPFALVKFRTMKDLRDSNGRPLANERRLTRVGRILRASSLDELPELWNVLKGDMSLIGPRPLLVDYLPIYTATQSRRHEVRPGMTGWAQVNGRNMVSWEERFEMDVWYVDNRTLWLDIQILAMTIGKVLSREGISVPGKATIDRFKASK